MSNTVSFICHLITSMGHCSHPPGSAWQTLFSAPAVGTGCGTRSASPRSPQDRKGEHLDLPLTPLCCLAPLFGPPTQPPSQTPSGGWWRTAWHPLQLTTGEAPTPPAPGPALPASLPAHSLVWGPSGLPATDSIGPDTRGGPWLSACQVHATRTAVHGSLAAQGLVCACLPASLLGPPLGQEGKGCD